MIASTSFIGLILFLVILYNFHEIQSVGNRVGVAEPFLMRMAHGAPIRTSSRSSDGSKGLHAKSDYRHGITNSSMLSEEQTIRVCKRFYVALILSRLVQVSFFLFSFLR